MENQNTNQSTQTPLSTDAEQTNSAAINQPKKSSSKSKILILGAITVIFITGIGGAYVLGQNKSGTDDTSPTPSGKACTQEAMICPDGSSVEREGPNCEFTPCLATPTSSPSAGVNGANLENIKYTLPTNWTAKISEDSLLITPTGGGYLSIKAYDYDDTTREKEFYCQTVDYCMTSTSHTPQNIGNVSGYIASGLDNSGGGSEYYGAKGNKFYIISTFSPPSPSEFEKNFLNVLNSLVF